MATTPSKDAPTSPPKADPPKAATPPDVKTTTIGAPPPQEPQQAPPPSPPQHAPPPPPSNVGVNIHGQPPRPNMAPASATPKSGIGDNTRAEMEAGAANLAQYKDRDKAEHEAGRRNINPGQTDEQPE